jgi:hypothetical protein
MSGQVWPATVVDCISWQDGTNGLLGCCVKAMASHQAILLSTDEEIDAACYKKLEPSISHSYTLPYDHTRGGTNVVEGFAFAEA